MKTTVSGLAVLISLLFIPGLAFAESRCNASNYQVFIWTLGVHICDLRGMNLAGMNFGGANLVWVDFEGANLTGANFYGANLTGANLSGADLSGANFGGAILEWANFEGANLTGAKGLSPEQIADARAQDAIFE